jgi:hypothetical protein
LGKGGGGSLLCRYITLINITNAFNFIRKITVRVMMFNVTFNNISVVS